MPNFDQSLVDPSVTPDEIEKALDDTITPAEFPDVETQDEVDATDIARGFTPVVPATPHQAILNARTLRDDHTFVGVGMCLRTVHGPIFKIPALWPDAETAMEHSAPFHPLTDPNTTDPALRGTVGFASNGRHGHVWLELGGGLVSTTDFHENGFESVALRSRMLEWCGALRFGWGEVLDGIDVWPNPAKPTPTPKPFTLAERIQIVHADMLRARENGHAHRAARLKLWLEQLQKRQAAK